MNSLGISSRQQKNKENTSLNIDISKNAWLQKNAKLSRRKRTLSESQLRLNNKLLNVLRNKDTNSDQKIAKIKNLLEQEADINFQDGHTGKTALHLAAENGELKVAKYLMDNGALPTNKNKDNKTPRDLATSWPMIRVLNGDSATYQSFEPDSKRRKIHDLDTPSTSMIEEKFYDASGVKNALHGTVYQLKLLMLYLKRGIDKGYAFSLATEMNVAEKFDDLVFKFEDQGQIKYIFLQAKHKQADSTLIRMNDLLNVKDGEFSLAKYFSSFRKIKRNPYFEGTTLQDFVLATNIDLHTDIKNDLQEITSKDEFLHFEKLGREPSRYRLSAYADSNLKKKLIPLFESTSDLQVLAKTLAECVINGDNINLKKSIFNSYHGALKKENIIDISKSKMHDDFINNNKLSPSAEKFRGEFEKELKILTRKDPIASSDVFKHIENINLKLSHGFGKKFELNSNPQISNTEEFAKALVSEMDSSQNGDVTLEVNRSRKDILSQNIDQLAGHILIQEEGTKQSKIKFSSSFLDNTPLQGNLDDFKLKLIAELNQKNINFDALGDYKFSISGFKTCEDGQQHLRTALPDDNVTPKEIHEFLEHLVLAVNQPNEIELSKIITDELGTQFNEVDRKYVYSRFQEKMLDWMKEKEGRFFSREEGIEFFKNVKDEIFGRIRFNVRQPVERFVGRSEYIKTLHSAIQSQRHVALTGLDGTGKSELARMYIQKYSHMYDNNIVWINAENYNSIVESFMDLATHKKVGIEITDKNGEDKNVASIVKEVYEFFGKKKCLFVFDDAKKSDIQRFLEFSSPNQKILITSSNNEWDLNALEVGPFSTDDAKLFVRKSLSIHNNKYDKDIINLVRKMDNFPLALEQSTAYINKRNNDLKIVNTDYHIQNYLDEFETGRGMIHLDPNSYIIRSYMKSIQAINNLARDRILTHKNGNEALHILDTISYFGSDNIPSQMFVHNEESLSALNLLRQYSLIYLGERDGSFKILGPLQESRRIELNAQNNEVAAIENALQAFNGKTLGKENVNHAMFVWNYAIKYDNIVHKSGNFPSRIVQELHASGRYEDSYVFATKAIETLENKLEPGDPHTLNLKEELASTLDYQGKYKSALDVYTDVVGSRRRISENSFDTLKTWSHIATVYKKMGRFNDGLNICKMISSHLSNEPFSPIKYININNEASIHVAMKEYSKALDLYKKVYEANKDILHETNPQILTVRRDIAETQFKKGDFGAALQTYNEIYSTIEPNSPDALSIKNAIAMIHMNNENFETAYKMLEEVHEAQSNNNMLGPDHPDTLSTYKNMGDAMFASNYKEDGFRIYQTVYSKRKDVLGHYHPDTLKIGKVVAEIHYARGKYPDALEIYKDIYSHQRNENHLGPNHPETLRTQNSIAELYQISGNYHEAREMFSEVYHNNHAELGNQNPIILQALRGLTHAEQYTNPINPNDCFGHSRRRKRNLNNCLFSKEDVEKFSNGAVDENSIDKINIDTEKFLNFIKNSPDRAKNSQLIEFVKDKVNIEGNYKHLFSKVLKDNGLDRYYMHEHIQSLSEHSLTTSVSKVGITKARLMNAAGKIQLLRAIHGVIASCKDGFTSSCGLNIGGLGWSLLSQPIEHIVVKFAPVAIRGSEAIAIKFLPKALGNDVRMVIRIAGLKMGTTVARGVAGGLISVFDIVDIALSTKSLISCSQRDAANPCDSKEIRDSIASISFSTVSFVSSVVLTAAGMTGVGLVVGLAIMVGYGVYSGISSVIEYHEKYHTTRGEGWSVFWRTILFQDMSSDVKHLRSRTDIVNSLAKNAWKSLGASPDEVFAYGLGFGEDLVVPNLTTGYAKIIMNWDRVDTTKLSRVVPNEIKNATMICLPQPTGQDYEKDIRSSVPTAVHYCENSMVIADKRKMDKGSKLIVYNLESISRGEISGSDTFDNEYIVYGGDAVINGGANNMNRVLYLTPDKYTGKFKAGENSNNIIDYSQVVDDEVNFKFATKTGKYMYIGRPNKVDNVVCPKNTDYLVDANGGPDLGSKDNIKFCKRVIVSPFTNVYDTINGTFYVSSKDYQGSDLHSRIDVNGGGTIIFPSIDLLNDLKNAIYFNNNNTLSLSLKVGTQSNYTIDIKNYTDPATYQQKFILIDKHGSNIIPRISNSDSEIDFFELHTSCPKECTIEDHKCVEDHHEKILNNDKNYKVLSIIQCSWKNSISHMIFGTTESDIINFDEATVFAKGDKGRDIYIVHENLTQQSEIEIDNFDENAELDVLLLPEIPEHFVVNEFNLNIYYKNTDIKFKNYLKGHKYGHLLVMNNQGETFIPSIHSLLSASVPKRGNLIPFFHATQSQNMFLLPKRFKYDQIVIDAKLEDLKRFKDNNDLILMREGELPFIIKIHDYYVDLSKWIHMDCFLWENDNFVPYLGLSEKLDEIVDYDTKLQEDYNAIVKEYVVDFKKSYTIIPNQDDARLGVLILKNINPTQISLKISNADLILMVKKMNKQVKLKNWLDKKVERKITNLVFDAGLEPITIRNIDQYSAVELNAAIASASSAYKNRGAYTEQVAIDVKCVISLNGFKNENATYHCLGFTSLNEQINFVQDFCTLEPFSDFSNASIARQVTEFTKKLQSDYFLNQYYLSDKISCKEILSNFTNNLAANHRQHRSLDEEFVTSGGNRKSSWILESKLLISSVFLMATDLIYTIFYKPIVNPINIQQNSTVHINAEREVGFGDKVWGKLSKTEINRLRNICKGLNDNFMEDNMLNSAKDNADNKYTCPRNIAKSLEHYCNIDHDYSGNDCVEEFLKPIEYYNSHRKEHRSRANVDWLNQDANIMFGTYLLGWYNKIKMKEEEWDVYDDLKKNCYETLTRLKICDRINNAISNNKIAITNDDMYNAVLGEVLANKDAPHDEIVEVFLISLENVSEIKLVEDNNRVESDLIQTFISKNNKFIQMLAQDVVDYNNNLPSYEIKAYEELFARIPRVNMLSESINYYNFADYQVVDNQKLIGPRCGLNLPRICN